MSLNMVNAVLIQPNGQSTPVTLESGSLDAVTGLLGVRYIEMVMLSNGHSMYIDEEGKLADQPLVNVKATKETNLYPADVIVGPALILGPPDDDGYDTSINPDMQARLLS